MGLIGSFIRKIQIKMELVMNNRKPLSEVATILTENQFWKLADKDPHILEGSLVAVSPILERGGRCAEDWTGGLPEGYAAVLPGELSALFIAFLLNTLPCQVELFEGKFNVMPRVKVNKKKISSLLVPVLPEEEQRIYGLAESLYDGARDLQKENPGEDRYSYMVRVMENLCNSLAIDLFAHQFFVDKGINLYEHWKEVVTASDEENDVKRVMDALVDKDSPLRNDIMKMQIVFDK